MTTALPAPAVDDVDVVVVLSLVVLIVSSGSTPDPAALAWVEDGSPLK